MRILNKNIIRDKGCKQKLSLGEFYNTNISVDLQIKVTET